MQQHVQNFGPKGPCHVHMTSAQFLGEKNQVSDQFPTKELTFLKIKVPQKDKKFNFLLTISSEFRSLSKNSLPAQLKKICQISFYKKLHF